MDFGKLQNPNAKIQRNSKHQHPNSKPRGCGYDPAMPDARARKTALGAGALPRQLRNPG